MHDPVTTTAIDVEKVEREHRRYYEKIEQVNKMYIAAKALGFPERLASELKYKNYEVVVCVPRCFDPKYYKLKTDVLALPSLFLKLRIKGGCAQFICEQVSSGKATTEEIPDCALWLLVCMKLFYRKDWDGKKWIDEKEAFDIYQNSASKFSEKVFEQEYPIDFKTNIDLHEKVMKDLSEQMAKQLDEEIMRAVRKSPEDWHVQVGNVVYGPFEKGKIYGI